MIVTEIETRLAIPRDSTRSRGLHMSDVIRDIAFRLGKLDTKWRHEEMNPVVIRMGMAWEKELAEDYPDIIFHPGEMVVDGIYMTPDGFRLEDGSFSLVGFEKKTWAVHEFKYTRKSARNFTQALRLEDKKVWMFLTQIKGYCMGAETRLGYLHVAFANGDYSPNSQPLYRLWSLEFTKQEIFDNWAMIRDHAADIRRKEGGK